MLLTIVLFSLYLTLIAITAAIPANTLADTGITVLLNETSIHILNQYDASAIIFVAPWNHHFKRELGGMRNHSFPTNVKLAIVDIQKTPNLSQRYGISSYPHVVLFRQGIVSAHLNNFKSKKNTTFQMIQQFLDQEIATTVQDAVRFISNKNAAQLFLRAAGIISFDSRPENQKQIFFSGYRLEAFAKEVFSDFVPQQGFIHQDEVGQHDDILVIGMHKGIRHFPYWRGRILLINGEAYGVPTQDERMIGCFSPSSNSQQQNNNSLQVYYVAIAALSMPPRTLEKIATKKVRSINEINERKHFLLYVATKCHDHRERAFDLLAKINTVHYMKCHGKVVNTNKTLITSTPRATWWNNAKLYHNYRFALVMENQHKSGYITEKILLAFAGKAIPIYYGTQEIFKLFNKAAFVFFDIDKPNEALTQIQRLEENKTALANMMNQPVFASGALRTYFSLQKSKTPEAAKLRHQIRTFIGLYNATIVKHHAGLFSQLHFMLNTFISNVLYSNSSSSKNWIIQPYAPASGSSWNQAFRFDAVFRPVRAKNHVLFDKMSNLQPSHNHFEWTRMIFQHIFKPNQQLQDMITHYRRVLNLTQEVRILGIHCRRGDKITREGIAVISDELILSKRNHDEKKIYILSDDSSFKQSALNFYSSTSDVEIIFFPFNDCLKIQHGNTVTCFLTATYLMAQCSSRFIGSLSSNVGRFILTFRGVKSQFEDMDGLISMKSNNGTWFLSNVDHCYIVEGVASKTNRTEFCGYAVHPKRCPHCLRYRNLCPPIAPCAGGDVSLLPVESESVESFHWNLASSAARYQQAPRNPTKHLSRNIPSVNSNKQNKGGSSIKFYIYDYPDITLNDVNLRCDKDNTADMSLLQLLRQHPDRVQSPHLASMFVIPTPIYQSFKCDASSGKKYHVTRVNRAMNKVIYNVWFKKQSGRDHLLLGHSYHFSLWAANEQFLSGTWIAALQEVSVTRFESYNQKFRNSLLYGHHKAWNWPIVVPYTVPSELSIINPIPTLSQFQSRPFLLFYHIRRTSYAHNATALRRAPLVFNASDCNIGYEIPRRAWLSGWSNSRFCLVVRGDTPTSHSFFSALTTYCIPVVISDAYQEVGMSFGIDINTVAIVIKEDSVLHNPWVILDTLRELSKEDIQSKLWAIQKLQPQLLYRHPNSSMVSLVIAEFAKKMKLVAHHELEPMSHVPMPVVLSSFAKGSRAANDFAAASFAMQTRHCRFAFLTHQNTLQSLLHRYGYSNSSAWYKNKQSMLLVLPSSWYGYRYGYNNHNHNHTNITILSATSEIASSSKKMVRWISLHAWPQVIPYEVEFKSLFFSEQRPGSNRHLLGFAMQTRHSSITEEGRNFSAKMTRALALVGERYRGKLACIFADSARFRGTLPNMKLPQSIDPLTKRLLPKLCTCSKYTARTLVQAPALGYATSTIGTYKRMSVSGQVTVGHHTFTFRGSLPIGSTFVAVVLTCPQDFARRQWIRATMDSLPVLFLIGRDSNHQANHNMTKEDMEFYDMIHFDIAEKYGTEDSSLPRKVQGAFQILKKYQAETTIQYIVKMDHDVFIDDILLQKQVMSLNKLNNNKNNKNNKNKLNNKNKTQSAVYFGSVWGGAQLSAQRVHRNPKSKTYVPKDIFPDDFWPPFCAGWGYVLDVNSAGRISELAKHRRIIACEDAHTGVLAHELGIAPVHAPIPFGIPDLPEPKRLCGKLMSSSVEDQFEPELRLVISNKNKRTLTTFAFRDDEEALRNAVSSNDPPSRAADVIEDWLKMISAGTIEKMRN